MDYLTYDNSYWACDIEADGFRNQASVIWCVCVENVVSGESRAFREKEHFKTWIAEIKPVFVGHNFLAYDAPVLNRLWGTRISTGTVIDTFVLSQMYSPSLAGGHGLDDWGVRLNNPKLGHTDFSQYSADMLTYCIQDTALTADVYRALCKRMKGEGFSERGVELEHLAWHIIQNKQRQNGFPFDQEKADLLYAKLRAREEELKQEIYRLWPPVLQHVRTFARAFKKDGSRTSSYQRNIGQYPKTSLNEDGSYNAYDYVSFDLGSPKQRIQKLLDNGWEPVNFTEKGNPKIDEDEMVAYAKESGIKEVQSLADWCVVNARANMIRNWMNSMNPETGRIHGSLFLASTLRYRHSKPNTANIPGNEALYGHECRGLWYAGEDDYVLVGMDAKGIQLRILANYLNHADFSEAILSEDPHSANQKSMGLPTRSLTKTITYSAIMGSGVTAMAKTAGTSVKEAQTYKDMFYKGLGLDRLIARLQKEWRDTGRITVCSGERVLVPQDYQVIPYLLQADEACLMKQTMIYIDQEIRKRKFTPYIQQVGMIHDELQYRVRADLAESFVEFALPCFGRSGDSFDYLIPIEGDAKIGDNWSMTH